MSATDHEAKYRVPKIDHRWNKTKREFVESFSSGGLTILGSFRLQMALALGKKYWGPVYGNHNYNLLVEVTEGFPEDEMERFVQSSNRGKKERARALFAVALLRK